MKSSIKNIVGVSVLALVAWMNSGCDFLNTEPHRLVPEYYFNTDDEVKSFLTGTYAPIMEEHFYGGNYELYMVNGDDLTFYQRLTAPTCMTCFNTNSADQYTSNLWKVLYQGINRANMLIENMADPALHPDLSDATRQSAKAEATCLRAFYYFNLVQGWGDVPFRLHSTNDVSGNDMPRTDKQVIYDTIINDLIASLPHLPVLGSPTPETLSQTAVKALLARIWLFRAGECYRDNQIPDDAFRKHCFTEAARWAQDVIDHSGCSLVPSYKQVFLDYCQNDYNSTGHIESIWEVPFTGTMASAEKGCGRIGNIIGMGSTDTQVGISTHKDDGGLNNPGYSYQFTYGSLKLYEMYINNHDTLRRNWNLAPFVYIYGKNAGGEQSVLGRKYYFGCVDSAQIEEDGKGYQHTIEAESTSNANKTRCCAKYRREYEPITPKDKNYTCINYPLIRYSDVLLMCAEAYNELGEHPELVKKYINMVRERAGVPLLDGSEDMRQAIKDERAMELCFESIRHWDLIRWGDFVQTMHEAASYVSQDGWTPSMRYAEERYLNVTAAYNYFPIPDTELSINKAIKNQNPGW